MTGTIRALLFAGFGVAALVLGGPTASARIACDGAYQIVNGQPVATPYCEDGYLAEVAREYGMRVSAAAVRSSPSVKERVCRLIGHDNRAQSACAAYREPFLRRRF
ncbi:MAG: hypothetical protein KJZ80_16360 [Hyphomicrobiaceae bacterium]|nr:hypothetical protein [Hyphomicrobiaceae bacterium]